MSHARWTSRGTKLRRRSPFGVSLLVCLATVFCASRGFAEQRSAEELAVARKLFEQARAAQKREDWAECERQVTEAVEIIETPGLRFHLAFCKERQGRWVAALVDYKRAQELVQGGVQAEDVDELLGPAIQRLEAEIPKLELVLKDVPEGTTLYLDGKEKSARLLGKEIPVDPGGVRVSVSAPEHEPFERHINLLKGERRSVSVVLAKQDAEDVQPEPPPAMISEQMPENSELGAKGWVLIGEGALTLGGLAVGVFSSARKSDLSRSHRRLVETVGEGGCALGRTPHSSCNKLKEVNDEINQASAFALAGYIAAGAGLTAFVTTWLVWDVQPRRGEQAWALEFTPTDGGALGRYTHQF